ncbi:L,D-transpeptidase [Nocardia stercoris]|uniref:L,D-transpeptidase n=1 Tax=Nocardia stercoris TaxID=2483361 RepID=A0A3M2L6U7_9NOCA|nr:L,D-transpeptidase [Nocardia stercoris]RMI32263.1 L,D-transpeptidase [Nocardia stercoris]
MRTSFRRFSLVLAVAATSVATTAAVTGTAGAASIAPRVFAVSSVSPSSGERVGVAAPISIRFANPVSDRAAAERTVAVSTAAGPLAGSFQWSDDQNLVWKAAAPLPANTGIGVQAGRAHTDFTTDYGTTADADMSAHTFTVYIPGQAPRVMPASMGRPGHETPVGTFPVMERDRYLQFDSATIGIPRSSPDGYYFVGDYAERLTSGGVFVHSAPWSVDSQGVENVSHGCINLAPDDAEWYYENVSVGDPVTTHW